MILSEEERRQRRIESQRRYRARNPEKVRESSRRYIQNNKEKIKEARKKNRTKDYERQKKWREENRDRCLEYERAYRERNREKIQEKWRLWDRARRGCPRRKAVELVAAARSRARRRGFEFDIDADFIEQKILLGKCEATGIDFVIEANHPRTPSIDRIDSAIGYSKDNVRVTCFMYNQAKRDWTHEDLLMFCREFTRNADDA